MYKISKQVKEKIKALSYAFLLIGIMISTQNCRLDIGAQGEVIVEAEGLDPDMDQDTDTDSDTDTDTDTDDDNMNTSSSRMHMVGLYRGYSGKASVLVLGKGEVDLVLSAYESVNWIVNTVPAVKIKRVLLLGYHKQTVSGLSSSTQIVDKSDMRSADCMYPYSLKAPKNYNALSATWSYHKSQRNIEEKGVLDMVRNGFELEYCGTTWAEVSGGSEAERNEFLACSLEVADFQTYINNRIYIREVEDYMGKKLATFQGARSPSASQVFSIQN